MAKPKEIVYGEAPANDGVTYSGFANGDDAGKLNIGAFAAGAMTRGTWTTSA